MILVLRCTEAGAKKTAAATLLSIFNLSAGLEKRFGGGHCRLKHMYMILLVRFHAEQAKCHRQSMSDGYLGPGLHLGNRALFDIAHCGYQSCNGSWLGLPSLEAG